MAGAVAAFRPFLVALFPVGILIFMGWRASYLDFSCFAAETPRGGFAVVKARWHIEGMCIDGFWRKMSEEARFRSIVSSVSARLLYQAGPSAVPPRLHEALAPTGTRFRLRFVV